MQFFTLRVALCFAAVVATATPALAIELACRKGVHEKTFVTRKIDVPRSSANKLRNQLEAWGKRYGMIIGGVGVAEGPNEAESWSTILQSRNHGIVLTVTTPARGKEAVATAKNNCWAPAENWKPYWTRLEAQMTAWGYRFY